MRTETLPYNKIERAYDIKRVELNSEDELYEDFGRDI